MDVLRTADKTYTAHAVAVSFDGFVCRFNHFGVGRKAQVIISAEIQYNFIIYKDLGALWPLDHALFFIQT